MADSNNIQYTISLKDINVASTLGSAEGAAKSFEGTLGGVQTSSLAAAGAIAAIGFALKKVIEIGKEIFDTTAKFESLNNVINYTSLDAKDAAANHQFLNHVINDYKLPIEETTEGFADFSAAMLGSSLQGQGARDVFDGVSVATIAMHLNAQRAQQVFLALGQMMSKGTVQAQELKLQLGNALPGSFQIAARSMGLTTAELTKFMEDGKLVASDFLPKFAAELKKTFGGAVPNAVKSLTAQATDLNNQIVQLKLSIGEDLQPVFLNILSLLKDGIKMASEFWAYLRDSEAMTALSAFWDTLKAKLTTIWEAIRQPLSDLFAAFAQWREPLEMVFNLIGGAFLFIIDIIGQVLPYLIKLQTYALNFLKVIFNVLEKLKVFDIIKGIIMFVFGIIQKVANILSWIFDNIIDPVVNKIEKAYHFIADILGLSEELSKTVPYTGAGMGEADNGVNKNNPFNKQPAAGGVIDWYNPAKSTYAGLPTAEQPKAKATSTDLGKATGTSKTTGQKILNIKIDIKSLIGTLNVNTTNLGESMPRIKEMVTSVLLSAVNDSQIVPER